MAEEALADNKTTPILEDGQKESKDILKPTEEEKPKKSSPFLTTEVVANPTEDEPAEESSLKKQHELIDKTIGDKSIFNSTVKLYFFSQKTEKFETRGEGKIAILMDDAMMYKVLMIRDQVMLKGCNHYIAPGCPLTASKKAKNSYMWTALNDKSDAESNYDKTVYFATFKTEEDFAKFKENYDKGMEENQKKIEEKKASAKASSS